LLSGGTDEAGGIGIGVEAVTGLGGSVQSPRLEPEFVFPGPAAGGPRNHSQGLASSPLGGPIAAVSMAGGGWNDGGHTAGGVAGTSVSTGLGLGLTSMNSNSNSNSNSGGGSTSMAMDGFSSEMALPGASGFRSQAPPSSSSYSSSSAAGGSAVGMGMGMGMDTGMGMRPDSPGLGLS